MTYVAHLVTLAGIYYMLAASLNLLTGYLGLVSLCQATFYALGAYVSTLLSLRCDLGFMPAMGAAVLSTMALSLLIAVPSLRLRGNYFVLTSVGFQVLVLAVLQNWESLTNGPFGIAGIPRATILGFQVSTNQSHAVLSVGLALVVGAVCWLITQSPYGRALRAIREDEIAAASVGKDVPRIKIVTFAICAGLAAIPGAVYASYARYIDPSSFVLNESVFILSVVVIGGAGNQRGPVAGAVLMALLPELLRFAALPDAIASNVRELIYGLLLIVLMRFRPRGLAGGYAFN